MKTKTQSGAATQCVHAGTETDRETGAIRRPIYMNNSYRGGLFVPAPGAEGGPSFAYARDGHANEYYLERKLATVGPLPDGMDRQKFYDRIDAEFAEEGATS